jgi:hypothetical protein
MSAVSGKFRWCRQNILASGHEWALPRVAMTRHWALDVTKRVGRWKCTSTKRSDLDDLFESSRSTQPMFWGRLDDANLVPRCDGTVRIVPMSFRSQLHP